MNTELLKYLIAKSRRTEEEVANILCINRQTLAKKITGKTEFKLSEIRKLQELLTLSTQDVIDIFFS